MFKKILAAAMSAMLLLYPLAASAVTWDDVRTTLYPIIEKGEKADNIVIDGGSASFDTKDDTFFIKLKDLDLNEESVSLGALNLGTSNLDLTLENIEASSLSDYITKENQHKIQLNGSTHIGTVLMRTEKDADATLINNATMGNSKLPAFHFINEGTLHFQNNGTLKSYLKEEEVEIHGWIDTPLPEENATPENIQAALEAMDLDLGDKPVTILIWVDDSEAPFIIFTIEPETVVDNGPSPEMIRHWKELERQEKAIGGVCGSPYWLKQLYLGYQSLNLRLYLDGKQVNFKQDLGWAGKAPNKELILRINYDDPEKLTMRLDETVLDVLERADFTLITLKEKDGGIVMQYNVADLRAAYETYGLDDDDLLVVGGADDPVMKIGADGELKPVEE